MPLVTNKTRESAENCKKCAFNKLMNVKIDKNSVLYDQAKASLDAMINLGCNMCKHASDFEKVYGMKPYEFFTKNK